MTAGQTIYTCPECGGEVITLEHPYVAATTHTAGCSLSNGNGPDYIAALGSQNQNIKMPARYNPAAVRNVTAIINGCVGVGIALESGGSLFVSLPVADLTVLAAIQTNHMGD